MASSKFKFRDIRSREVRVSAVERAEEVVRSFSASGRTLFLIFSTLIIFSAAGLLFMLNRELLVTTPAYGASLSEGIMGSPRFINPVLAISDADRDVTSLVYSGLLRASVDGNFIPDLASNWELSDDGLTYTFYIRADAKFQDGTPVTADDVVFTIGKAQDPAIKSPLRANWIGVTAEKQDDRTVQFRLKSAYAPFIENLTIGILPKHLWQNVTAEEFPFSELNTHPVGSGPYSVEDVGRTPSGLPSSYSLRANRGYTLGEPYITKLELRFYQREEDLVSALRSGEIEAASGISPAALPTLKNFNIVTAPLDRVFGVFFNQNQSEVLRDHAVRQALGKAINRKDLVEKVLGGYGAPVSSPIPPNILRGEDAAAGDSLSPDDAVALAQSELADAGWKMGSDGVLAKTTGTGKNAKTQTLHFTLATGNVPELRSAAQYLKDAWTKVGASVEMQVYDQGDLSENIIRPRKYDALLFGEVVGRGLDLFAFWDSSQRNDPGLNIALYANSAVDKALGSLRTARTDRERQDLYRQFEVQFDKDIPAIFLYAPDFVYIFPNDVSGFSLGFVSGPSDRFAAVNTWYRETDRVWPFFTSQM